MDRLIKLELGRLNAHLPRNRVSLREALASPNPGVNTLDGSRHVFKREELRFLAGLLPEDRWDELRLPILISFEHGLGRGAAKIKGNVETWIAGKILGKEADGEMVIYRPEVLLLRRKLPTTTQYVFR
ncbi:MAG: hypothetical protein DRN83_01220 [Hadesarchaea archaeon]|nr:MAG: hypothetical protein DRN83_01220 [Hadesarchaea archaeon]HDI12911.1 DUF61 family protein [Hadesarchaea archaeon]